MRGATDYETGDALALIVADRGPGAADAAEAMKLVGGEFRGEVDWRGAGEGRFDHPGAIELIVAEAARVADDVLAVALPRIATAIAETSARAVVILDPEQIDIVAGAMLGRRVELLCDPTLAERAAAFAVAQAPFVSNRVHGADDDSESAQLRQLNEEVARISRVLARLTNEEKRPRAVADRPLGYGAPSTTVPAPSTTTAAEVRKLIRARRMRNQYLAEDLFEDPAWDMLLDLYAADLESAQVSVSSLCIAAAVAPTTALRWIARMTEAGLFERHPDPFDRRRAFLALSDPMRAKLERYFIALRQSGLGVI